MRKTPGRGQWIPVGMYLILFLFMLALNTMSLYFADDFIYSFSFWDKAPMRSLSQLFMSMRAHRYSMNGRLVAHILVQIFAMLPLWVFDIVNSLVFVGMIALIQKIAGCPDARKNGMLAAIFCGIWLTCPAFGSVVLWQDGACNYLWSVVAALLFLVPYVQEFINGKALEKRYQIVAFLALSFCMGAWSENTSAAAIGMALLLLLLMVFWQKRKLNKLWVWSMALAILGYLSIYTAPAQLRGKGAAFTVETLWHNFLMATKMYQECCGVLLAVFVLAFLVNLARGTERKRQLLSVVFLCGSLAANFILMFAEYYISRSAMAPTMFLLTADAIALYPLLEDRALRRILTAGLLVLVLMTAPAVADGVSDIYDTYQVMKQNETYLYECRDQGLREATVPIVKARTKYSVAESHYYLSTKAPEKKDMARYFGMDAIWGAEPES